MGVLAISQREDFHGVQHFILWTVDKTDLLVNLLDDFEVIR